MIMKMAQPTQLKQIINEVIGSSASKTLLNSVHAILDGDCKDPASQRKACSRIEQMVSLFIGPEAGRQLEERFRETLK